MRKPQLFCDVTGPAGLWPHEEAVAAGGLMELFLADPAMHLFHVVHNEDIPPSNVSMEFSCDSHIRFRTHLFLITNTLSQIRHKKIRILDIAPLAIAALGPT